MSWIALPLALAGGCGFSVTPATSSDGAVDGASDSSTPPDAGPDAPIDVLDAYVPDAQVCFGAGIGAICLSAVPTQPLVLPAAVFDTGAAGCTEVVTQNTVELCVMAGTMVTLAAGSVFRAVGTRPLVVVATSTLVIAGTIDVSSPRGGAPGAGTAVADCGSPGVGENDAGGAGGGAGGSFGGRGGDGGTGDTNNNGGPSGTGSGGTSLAAIVPTALRAGCPGADGGDGNQPRGIGGLAGGAVYLIAAGTLTITGNVFAAGRGGGLGTDNSGGGGGGSGGMVGLDAPTVTVTGVIAANGGGGGEGGGFNSGANGADGTLDATRAAGGVFNTNGGDGGLGSGGAILTGARGGDEVGGGGGGGGGAGHVYVKGALTSTGLSSPPATVIP